MAASPGPSNAQQWHSSFIGQACIVLAYLVLNLTTNLFNKWLMSSYGFGFPLFISMCHLAFSFSALLPIMLLPSFRSLHRPTLERSWIAILALGCGFAVTTGLNMVALATISLSLHQIIRSTLPVVSCMMAFALERRAPPQNEIWALALLVVGVVIAVLGAVGKANAPLGLLLCLLGTISNGVMTAVSGRILTEKVDGLRLSFYTAPVSCLMVMPFYAQLESKALGAYRVQAQSSFIGLLLMTCAAALFYSIAHSLMSNVTSTVATTVVGEMKIILVLLLSALLLGEGGLWTFKFVTGCTLAILGFCLYSHVRLRAAQLSPVPVIKGVPELTPLLRSTGGAALAMGVGAMNLGASVLRMTDKGVQGDVLGRRPGGPINTFG